MDHASGLIEIGPKVLEANWFVAKLSEDTLGTDDCALALMNHLNAVSLAKDRLRANSLAGVEKEMIRAPDCGLVVKKYWSKMQ